MISDTSRYDPVYRVVDITDEMRFMESTFTNEFSRLKHISSLGLLPEVMQMARYPKYEHHMGTVFQIECLIESESFKEYTQHHLPLRLAALSLHIGHNPYTHTTERAVLFAAGLGGEGSYNKARDYLITSIETVLVETTLQDDKKNQLISNIFSLKDYRSPYLFFSALFIINNREILKKGLHADDNDVVKAIETLIDSENPGNRLMQLSDKVDFVQRDALYLGTIRLEIHPKHLYASDFISPTVQGRKVSETNLLHHAYLYLREKFYEDMSLRIFSKLYERIVAGLVLSKRFEMNWLESYDDNQFRRLITDDININNHKAYLPKKWIDKARHLFAGAYRFIPIFELKDVAFEKEMSVFDVEYKLVNKSHSFQGLLQYPFDYGYLLDVDFPNRRSPFSVDGTEYYSVSLYQKDEPLELTPMLNILDKLSVNCTPRQVEVIRQGLSNRLSWTNTSRIDNMAVIDALAQAVCDMESEDTKGKLITEFIDAATPIVKYRQIMQSSEFQITWLLPLFTFSRRMEQFDDMKIYRNFIKGILSFPVQLLRCAATRRTIEKLYEYAIGKMTSIDPQKRGDLFEAIWLLHRIIDSENRRYSFIINGLVVTNLTLPKECQDVNEYDVVELGIDRNGNTQVWIYACSIADDYISKNRQALDDLTRYINSIYSNTEIHTRYVVPESNTSWRPRCINTGINYDL